MKRATALILLLFTLSGVSGLIYELVWIRLLSHLLGGTSFAISTVLAAFMGGLALGSRYFGDRADRATNLLRIYAGLELGIAALGAVAYGLIVLAPPVYASIASHLPAALVAVLRVVIALLLLLPPTFLMGGTLPILARFVVRQAERLGSGLGLLYAVNTFGAVVGCFLAGFVLIPGIGLPGSVALAVALNLAIGLLVLGLAREDLASAAPATAPTGEDAAPAPAGTSGENVPFPLLGALFALSGFASLGYELYWTRGLQPFLGNSTYAFSAMLTTFLLGLAAGGWLGGRLADRTRRPAALLGWVQIAAGAAALVSVLLIWGWLPGVGESNALSNAGLGWTGYLMRRFALALAVMAVPTLLIGMTFPIVSRIGIAGLEHLGGGVGRLYFLNTLGSIAGSLLAGFVLLPLLTAKGALVATALLSVAIGLVLHVVTRSAGAKHLPAAIAATVLLVVAAPLTAGFGRAPLSDTQTAQDVVLFDREDHAGHTRVYRKPSGDLHMSVDGFHIGGTEPSIVGKEKILAHLPLALHPDAKHTLSVGLGSGITLGSLATYPQLESLDCVEIVPGVVEGAAFFAGANRNVLLDPRVHVHVGDGVQFLLTSADRYDIISSDSKLNPEYAGNGPLLSRDYYELCRDRLAPGGVMVQWLASHLPVSELEVIARSFTEAFDHVAVFWLAPSNLVLAGSREPLVLDLDAVRRFAQQPGSGGDLASLHLDDPYVVAGLYLADRDRLAEALGDGPLNTWSRPRIEFTMLREYRRKSIVYHGGDNLRWLKKLRDPSSLVLRGEFDPEQLARFQASAAAVVDGYAVTGGIGHVGQGLEIWRNALAANPQDELLASLIEGERGAAQAREQEAAAAATTAADDPAALTEASMLRLEQKRPAEALQLLDQALKLDPDSRAIRFNRLLALRALRRTADLDRELDEFRKRFPEDPRGLDLSGRQAVDAGRLEEAVGYFREAVRLEPLNPRFGGNLAAALVQLKRWDEAAAAFAAVAEIEADFPRAAFHAAACYSLAGQTAQSAQWMRFCLDRGLVPRETFEQHEWFANLRASADWPQP